MPEHQADEAADQNESLARDKEKCEDVIIRHLGVTEAEIVQTGRIGIRNRNEERPNPRPIRVKLSEVKMKWKIVGKAKELKESRIPAIRKVGIAPDMTRKEREENELLRAELKSRRDAGEEDIKIFKGKIVKVTQRRN